MQNCNTWNGQPLDKLSGIYKALSHLDLPNPSQSMMQSISKGPEKNKFKLALVECLEIGGIVAKNETQSYLFSLVHSISEDVIDVVINELGYTGLPNEVFIRVGIDNWDFYDLIKSLKSAPKLDNAEILLQVHDILNIASMKIGFGFNFKRPVLKSKSSVSRSVFNLPLPEDEENSSFPGNAKQIFDKRVPYSGVRKSSVTAENFKDVEIGQNMAPGSIQNSNPAPSTISPKNTTNTPISEKNTEYLSTHVYGKGSALCFNASSTRNGERAIIVDAAIAVGERQYDWKNALKIQLSFKELPMLYAVLAGWRNSVKFSGHGTANDKSFEIERQNGENDKDGNFFVKMNAKGQKTRAVPMGAMDSFPVMMIVFREIMNGSPAEFQKNPELLLSMIKASQNIGVTST